jgi:tetratricopeptide (TPR) repeat protein/predicted Ser/Thr protein kinase
MNNVCPDLEQLEALVSNDSSPGDAAHVEKHVSQCSTCAQRLVDLSDNLSLVSPLRRVLRANDSATSSIPIVPGYEIIAELGRGGMGVVFEAQQFHPDRRVAIKILPHPTPTDPTSRALFEREARILARLQHPFVAAIYDAGQTASGQLFFAMERIQGQPLHKFVRDRHLTLTQRLHLMKLVCDGIAAVHQRGVIHRDIKPGNILIEPSGLPKVLDFGLAKILAGDEDSAPPTSVSVPGHIFGTLPYLSPEQARGDRAQVDVRSDVYALGVVMYEMLTGELPYPVDRTAALAAVHAICEQPPKSPTALPVEVQAILHKALDKVADRRYDGAAALGGDISRYLANQPVAARRPTLRYHAYKLIARHRVVAGLVGALLVTLVASAGWLGVLYRSTHVNYVRAQNAEVAATAAAHTARKEARVSQEVTDFLLKVFQYSKPTESQGQPVLARDLLDEAAGRIRNELGGDPLIQARLMNSLGRAYDSIGEYDSARSLLEDALSLWSEASGRDSIEAAKCANHLGELYMHSENPIAALELFSQSLAVYEQYYGSNDVHVALVMTELAEAMAVTGDLDGAVAVLEEALGMADGVTVEDMIVRTNGTARLAGVVNQQENYARAHMLWLEALDLTIQYGDTRDIAIMRSHLANVLAHLGELDSAIATARQSLHALQHSHSEDHPLVAQGRSQIGTLLLERGDLSEAEQHLRWACASMADALPENSCLRGHTLLALAACYKELGRVDAAHEQLKQLQKFDYQHCPGFDRLHLEFFRGTEP